jgi:hypothetical protein
MEKAGAGRVGYGDVSSPGGSSVVCVDSVECDASRRGSGWGCGALGEAVCAFAPEAAGESVIQQWEGIRLMSIRILG